MIESVAPAVNLLRLLQLSSPTLPVGTYAYSQGLESAVENEWINNTAELKEWLTGVLQGGLVHVDIPVLRRLYDSFTQKDYFAVQKWNDILLAYRETSELRKEERDKGHAMRALLNAMQINAMDLFSQIMNPAFATGYIFAVVHWKIELTDATQAYVWTWLENQIVSAMKMMPIGQYAGQKILSELLVDIPAIVQKGFLLGDDELGSLLPGHIIVCALHETQYSRLFRS